MKTLITKHVTKRLKQRLGLSRRAHKRHINKVLEKGIVQYRDIKKRLLYVWYDYRKYIFKDYKGLKAILITVFPREKTLNISSQYKKIIPITLIGQYEIKG